MTFQKKEEPLPIRGRRHHPELARHYWRAQRLWSPSYYAGTAGGAPLDTLKRYIENQNRPA